MDRHVASIIFFIVSCIYCTLAEEGRHTRFEYKQSFKGPHLVNKQGNIPFWTYYGSKNHIFLFFLYRFKSHLYTCVFLASYITLVSTESMMCFGNHHLLAFFVVVPVIIHTVFKLLNYRCYSKRRTS